MNLFKNLWKKSLLFKGASTTKEFFLSLLANWTAMMALLPVPVLMILLFSMLGISGDMAQTAVFAIITVYMLIFLLPIPALLTRRMRDSGHPIWQQLLLLLGIPLYGFILVGLLKPAARKHCYLSKLAYVLLLGSLGGFLWTFILFSRSELFEPLGIGLLAIGTVGILLGGVGGKIDELRGKADSADSLPEPPQQIS